MPKSIRHQRMAARAARTPLPRLDYEITEPSHRPDLRGEFAGVKVQRRGNRQVVSLTARQAKFYLDQGVLRPIPGAARAAPALRTVAAAPKRQVTAMPRARQ